MIFTPSYVVNVLNIRLLAKQKHLFEHIIFTNNMKLIIVLIFI